MSLSKTVKDLIARLESPLLVRAYVENFKYYQAFRAADWRRLNRKKCVELSTRRTQRVRRATPKWLTEEDKIAIQNIYVLAKDLEVITGKKYHVDHIVPIAGKQMSGLHVPWNLRVLPAEENLRKSARLPCPEECRAVAGYDANDGLTK